MANDLVGAIEGRETGPLDPALVGRLLRQALAEHDELIRLRVGLDHMRTDYIARITGMIKAVAAASRRRNALALATEEVAALDKMTPDELIDTHRRVSARFRDAFPASFGGLEMRGAAR